jgi:hypothetical protein
MASGVRGPKQTGGYYVPLGNLVTASSIKTYVAGSGAGGSFLPGTFVNADWAIGGGPGVILPLISSVGAGLLKDMGKTVVSSNRTFRKVQLVVPGGTGVSSSASTAGPFYTGYIELATGPSYVANSEPARVGFLPGLM